MTSDELDALDRECAEWMGWTSKVMAEGFLLWTSADGKHRGVDLPSPTRSWPDFGALLLALGERGIPVAIRRNGKWGMNGWTASVAEQTKHCADSPMVALCMAVAALKGGSK